MYVTLNQFMKMNNIGHDVALQILYNEKIPYIKTDGGRYKIFIDENKSSVPLEKYEAVVRENEKLKTIISNISQTISIYKIEEQRNGRK